AELRRWGKREVAAVGFDRSPIKTMAGLRLTPDVALGEVRASDVELFVAAICAATLAVGRAGLLNERRHTSNMRGYLERHVPEYEGQSHYVDSLAVRDRHLITASGLGAVDFARAVFAELSVFSS